MKRILPSIVIVLLTICSIALATQSYWVNPTDARGEPLPAGLGTPYLFEPTASNTTYDLTNRVAIPLTGNDTFRQYRHIQLYNPSTTRTIYVCVGTSTGCSINWYKVRPGHAFIHDFTFFGISDNKTHIYWKLDSAGTTDFDMEIW